MGVRETLQDIESGLNDAAMHMHPASTLQDRAGTLEQKLLLLKKKAEDALRETGERYMLISVYEREITTEIFGSLNEAQVAMRSEMIQAGVERELLYRCDKEFNEQPIKDPEEPGVFGESEESGYVNNKNGNSDWRIVKIN